MRNQLWRKNIKKERNWKILTIECFFQVRNAIQALQILASSPQSNPNLPTPAGRSGSGVLARSSSHPPDALCWNPPTRLIDVCTQTDWPVDFLEIWVRSDPHRILKMLSLDPDAVLGPAPSSPTPSPSSPPPPPYEPLSPIGGSPSRSPDESPGRVIFTKNKQNIWYRSLRRLKPKLVTNCETKY